MSLQSKANTLMPGGSESVPVTSIAKATRQRVRTGVCNNAEPARRKGVAPTAAEWVGMGFLAVGIAGIVSRIMDRKMDRSV